MGWYFTHGATKADAIAEFVRGHESSEGYYKTLKHCVRGNAVYALCESAKVGEEPKRFIAVALLAKSDGSYGSKIMDESMHPYYYACPVSYLDECTPPLNESSAKWRAIVRARHAAHNRKLAVGDVVKLVNDWVVTITSVKPLNCVYEGRTYRLRRADLASEGA